MRMRELCERQPDGVEQDVGGEDGVGMPRKHSNERALGRCARARVARIEQPAQRWEHLCVRACGRV
jgi:hypothetical protein